MPTSRLLAFRRFTLVAATLAFLAGTEAGAAPVAAIQDLARQEQQPLLDTLRDLVSIESGSGDSEGLAQIVGHQNFVLRCSGAGISCR